ncbi:hypothetical protein BZG36_00771 [Bifiguratus adelaidae]|uniref:Uncharacterized protein n=1 Tax=Bifiguratus adelaidae TaxID=1938954 RepID=A0A261Y6P0_9FUNG|nr:hypothetical protein BZG36_00771 [Bifiguratus adelaidae]
MLLHSLFALTILPLHVVLGVESESASGTPIVAQSGLNGAITVLPVSKEKQQLIGTMSKGDNALRFKVVGDTENDKADMAPTSESSSGSSYNAHIKEITLPLSPNFENSPSSEASSATSSDAVSEQATIDEEMDDFLRYLSNLSPIHAPQISAIGINEPIVASKTPNQVTDTLPSRSKEGDTGAIESTPSNVDTIVPERPGSEAKITVKHEVEESMPTKASPLPNAMIGNDVTTPLAQDTIDLNNQNLPDPAIMDPATLDNLKSMFNVVPSQTLRAIASPSPDNVVASTSSPPEAKETSMLSPTTTMSATRLNTQMTQLSEATPSKSNSRTTVTTPSRTSQSASTDGAKPTDQSSNNAFAHSVSLSSILFIAAIVPLI